ncbi:MAG: N-acetylmuramoyl-L-alanine amidase, partial [Planctomycetes bacterium]|nr:N-acetylmuramoyl-L-alanine amidase [Planctomycetota bacterium]
MSSALFTSIHSEAGRGGILAACLAVVLCVGPSYGQAAAEYYAVSTADLPIHGNFAQTDNLPGEIYLPGDTRVLKITVSEDTAVVMLSPEVLANLDEAMLTTLFDEFRKLFYDVPQVSNIQITCKGKLLSSYLPPAPDVTPLAVEAPATTYQMMTETTGLSGKSICIGPSHGRQWNGSSWGWQRGDSCGFGYEILEDTNSIRLMQYLHQYLTQDGAAVYVPRQLDETDCCHPSETRPFWHMAAYSWLYYEGYPCSVFGSNSGYCSSDLGPDRFNDDIRARPLFADYHNTDIYIAHHTNAYNGSASGTITYRDTAMEHPEHEADSYTLALAVQSNVCNVITNVYGIGDWYNRGVADSAGGFGEIRIPDRPACLIELAFHDNCTRDALFLIDPWFRSLTMWAIYKGVCDYFSVTPTWDLYSCEYVSDTIPSSMNPGQSYNVSITFTNRGVLWDSDHGF